MDGGLRKSMNHGAAIVACLSKSGEAMLKSGDLEGRSLPVKPGFAKAHVVIDRTIQ